MLKYIVMIDKLENIFDIRFNQEREIIEIREIKYPFDRVEMTKKEFMVLLSEFYEMINE